MPKFKQSFRVKAPLALVWELHDDPKALVALTPPPLRVKLLAVDSPIVAGSTLKFRMALIEPLGTTWHAIYDEYTPYQAGQKTCGFVDRALSGPFNYWHHRHTFTDNGDGTSTCTDAAEYRLLPNPLGAPINWLAYPTIIFLFTFRRFTTMVKAQKRA
jgi:ligand-binding SRPBCC domain-containing protein